MKGCVNMTRKELEQAWGFSSEASYEILRMLEEGAITMDSVPIMEEMDKEDFVYSFSHLYCQDAFENEFGEYDWECDAEHDYMEYMLEEIIPCYADWEELNNGLYLVYNIKN